MSERKIWVDKGQSARQTSQNVVQMQNLATSHDRTGQLGQSASQTSQTFVQAQSANNQSNSGGDSKR